MKTKAGIELTREEINLVHLLERLAKRWGKDGKRLWLWSTSGSLNIMMFQGDKNPFPLMGGASGSKEGVNPENVITTIDIRNDGGDW